MKPWVCPRASRAFVFKMSRGKRLNSMAKFLGIQPADLDRMIGTGDLAPGDLMFKKRTEYIANRTGLDPGMVERIIAAGNPWPPDERVYQIFTEASRADEEGVSPDDLLERELAKGRIPERLSREMDVYMEKAERVAKNLKVKANTVHRVVMAMQEFYEKLFGMMEKDKLRPSEKKKQQG
jgi:hypothetical protein